VPINWIHYLILLVICTLEIFLGLLGVDFWL
jgi:hypothetical protein